MHQQQIENWNNPALATDARFTAGVSDFARDSADLLAPRSRVVELGCGAGDDAAFFAEQGHDVLAIDVSRPLLDVAAQRYANIDNLVFHQGDITHRLEVGGQSTDLVFARLSLHYFDDQTTVNVFNEIHWTLRSGGHFAFMVKSVDDPLYGKGAEQEEDVFIYRGEGRHFFRRSYATEVLSEVGFIDVRITEGKQKLYGEPSAFLICHATRP